MEHNPVHTTYTATLKSATALWDSWLRKWAHPDNAKYMSTLPAFLAASRVPIRALGTQHRARIGRHLLSLNARDRYLRFGYSANDRHIEQYVANIDFARDEVFGIFDRSLLLIAVAHLAFVSDHGHDQGAEFGVTVLPHARGKGFGARLFAHAAQNASNRRKTLMYIHALSENTPMIRIASTAGARVVRHGCESEAYLQLDSPTLRSRFSEYVEQNVAQVDYHIKSRTRRPSSFSANMNKARPIALTNHEKQVSLEPRTSAELPV